MSSDINAVVESLILVFNEWHKLHIKLFSLCSGPSEQSTCEAVSQYTLFSKFPTPSCLNPACSYLILQTVSGLNRFHNCDVTKKGWFNDMTMMTLSSRFKLTNVDSMKWRWWRCSWSRFKLTNESEQWTWRGKKKKKKRWIIITVVIIIMEVHHGLSNQTEPTRPSRLPLIIF